MRLTNPAGMSTNTQVILSIPHRWWDHEHWIHIDYQRGLAIRHGRLMGEGAREADKATTRTGQLQPIAHPQENSERIPCVPARSCLFATRVDEPITRASLPTPAVRVQDVHCAGSLTRVPASLSLDSLEQQLKQQKPSKSQPSQSGNSPHRQHGISSSFFIN